LSLVEFYTLSTILKVFLYEGLSNYQERFYEGLSSDSQDLNFM